MNRIASTLCLTIYILNSATYAQPGGLQTMHMFNPYSVNPAYAGAETYTPIVLSYRRQWANLPSGPQNIYFSFHTRYQKAAKVTLKRDAPEGEYYSPNYTATMRTARTLEAQARQKQEADSMKIIEMQKELDFQKRYGEAKDKLTYRPYSGFGALIQNESFGPLSIVKAYGSFAHHISITPKTRVAMGASIGFTNYRFALEQVAFNDITDPVAQAAAPSRVRPEFNAGLMVHSSTYFIGISAHHLIPFRYQITDFDANLGNDVFPTQKQWFQFHGGVKLTLGEKMSIMPTALVRYNVDFPISFDVAAKWQYQMFWAGAFIRKGVDMTGVFLGLNVNQAIDIGYAYDISLSPVRTGYLGSHEIVVAYRFGSDTKKLKAKYFN